jgi:nucleoside-diphosphate-sugar epimerase
VPYLKTIIPAVNIIRLGRDGSTGRSELFWGNVTDRDIQGVDAIIHLAGKAHDTRNVSGEQEYFGVNYELTKQLYDLFLRSEASKFIYLSSVKAVADEVKGVLDEDVNPDPKTPYGRSKLMAEQHINTHPGSSEKEVYILRPCMIHGPGNKGNLNLLFRFSKLGLPYPLAAFENRRSFLSVDNLCFIIGELLTRSIPVGTYNVADDEAVGTDEVITLMSSAQNRRARLWRIPRILVLALAKFGDVVKLPLNSERLQKLTDSYVVSNTRIKSALNIGSMPKTARQGLIKTIRSFFD